MSFNIRTLFVATGLSVALAGCSSMPSMPSMPDVNLFGKKAPPCPVASVGPVEVAGPWSDKCANVRTTSSGLQYYQIKSGVPGAPRPDVTDKVTVDYEGHLSSDGTKFDSSFDRGQPATFGVGQVIAGWTEVLQLMTEGDEWMVYIPSELAYGSRARSEIIQPNSDLTFRINLIDVVGKGVSAQAAAPAPAPQPAPKPAGPARSTSDRNAWSAFTPWSKKYPGQQSFRSGVQYLVLKGGDPRGKSPDDNDIVVVEYEGRLAEANTVFDTTWTKAEPAVFQVDQVIPGWTQALKKMKPGDRWLIYIPAKEAYGSAGAGSAIPPNTDVVFEVLMLGIKEVK